MLPVFTFNRIGFRSTILKSVLYMIVSGHHEISEIWEPNHPLVHLMIEPAR